MTIETRLKQVRAKLHEVDGILAGRDSLVHDPFFFKIKQAMLLLRSSLSNLEQSLVTYDNGHWFERGIP